jgi:hypothetical protein
MYREKLKKIPLAAGEETMVERKTGEEEGD